MLILTILNYKLYWLGSNWTITFKNISENQVHLWDRCGVEACQWAMVVEKCCGNGVYIIEKMLLKLETGVHTIKNVHPRWVKKFTWLKECCWNWVHGPKNSHLRWVYKMEVYMIQKVLLKVGSTWLKRLSKVAPSHFLLVPFFFSHFFLHFPFIFPFLGFFFEFILLSTSFLILFPWNIMQSNMLMLKLIFV